VALDGSDRRWILDSARVLGSEVGWLKLGLEAFVAHGPRLVEEVAGAGAKVFLDLKLHDIPATVERAAANCAACGAAMLTVHAGGGRRMLEAAAAGARAGAGDAPTVVAVTVLTSLDRSALEELGIGREPLDLVLRWAALAREAGLGGVVASAREAAAVRRSCGDDFVIVTPGIRPASAVKDDQRRTLGPAEALVAGADLLVVGRPVTRSHDPAAAAREILREMSSRSAPDPS
jgi:orotidine-5'-phosphate decarboxylase